MANKKTPSGWKDHPIVIAAGSVVATVVFGVLLVKEVVLPVMTASLTSQIDSLTRQINSLPAQKTQQAPQSSSADPAIEDLKKRLKDTSVNHSLFM